MQISEHQAHAKARNLRVSWKQCTEVGRFVKGDSVEKAKNKLEKVIEKELHVPYTKFDSDAGHRSGGGPGGYPVKASKEILQLLESAESNAENEGLNTDNLKVENIITNQGSTFRTPKRHRGRSPKTAHITIILEER